VESIRRRPRPSTLLFLRGLDMEVSIVILSCGQCTVLTFVVKVSQIFKGTDGFHAFSANDLTSHTFHIRVYAKLNKRASRTLQPRNVPRDS
jgi:hypothetical protein